MNHDNLVKLAKTHFNSLPSSASTLPTLTPCRYTGSEMRFRNDDMPVAHIALAVEARKLHPIFGLAVKFYLSSVSFFLSYLQGVGWANPDYIPLMIASTIIGNYDRSYGSGSNMASKLAQVSHCGALGMVCVNLALLPWGVIKPDIERK